MFKRGMLPEPVGAFSFPSRNMTTEFSDARSWSSSGATGNHERSLGRKTFGDDNLLDVYIRYLRQKIERKDQPSLIHTVRGVGFILRQTTD